MNEEWTQVFRQLKADRFRTLLSLLGMAVGIFSIVASLSLVDSVQKSVQDSFAAFGSDLLYIEREPLEPDLNEDGVFRWWEYATRPHVTWREYHYLAERASYEQLAFAAYCEETVGIDGDWSLLVQQPIIEGRAFTSRELEEGLPVVIVGSEVEAKCGEPLWLEGKRYEVIGKFAKAGLTTVSPVDVDQVRLVPYKSQRIDPRRCSIVASGADPARLRSALREYRRLPPLQPDNFSINKLSFLLEEMNEIFAMVAKIGWIVGIFALLVGGFGIANMLYVSVEEKKPLIGIRRALGAKRKDVVREFLRESAVLSFTGGVAGVILVESMIAGGKFFGIAKGIQLTLLPSVALSGILTSLMIGILFGVAPARYAASLNPVDAIKNEG